MPDELVEIASYWTTREAVVARAALEGQDVRCFMEDNQVVDMVPLVANAVGSVKILVAASDAERARTILTTAYDDWPSDAETWICPGCGQPVDMRLGVCGECRTARPDDGARMSPGADAALDDSDEARRQTRNPYAPPRARGPDSSDADAQDLVVDDNRYARCPDCGQPRTATCPFCQTSGGRFKVAFTLEVEEPSDGPAMLICPTCDEPFQPGYLRRCESCGHDFGAGQEAPPTESEHDFEPRKLRMLAVALAALALIIGLFAYFAILLK
jgi:hypothetical protein